MRVSDSANYQRFNYSRISSGKQFSAMNQSSISSPIVCGRALLELLDQFRPRFQPRLAPRANSQVLRVIGQEQASDVESEPPNLVFRITSEVTFLEVGVSRFDLEQIRLALCDHVVKLDLPRGGILPERVIRGPKILEHGARIECEIPNGVLTPVENPSLIDECRCRDLRQS